MATGRPILVLQLDVEGASMYHIVNLLPFTLERSREDSVHIVVIDGTLEHVGHGSIEDVAHQVGRVAADEYRLDGDEIPSQEHQVLPGLFL